MATLKGQTIAASYQDLVKRADTYSQTGTNIELMDDSGDVQATGLYLESNATTSNVGIGVAAPVGKLDIFAANSGDPHLLSFSYSTSEGYGYFSADSTGSPYPLKLTTGQSRPFAIMGGNVGIGTSSPEGVLHVSSGAVTVTPSTDANALIVKDNANNGISILTPDANDCSIIWGSASSNKGTQAKWNYDADAFRFRTHKVGASMILGGDNGVSILTMSGASGSEISSFVGDVGIGTAAPTTKFEVYDDSAGADFTTVEYDYNTKNRKLRFGIASGNPSIQGTLTDNSATSLAINAGGGNVGIGTDSPSYLTHIQSASSAGTVWTGADELVLEGSGNVGLSLKLGANQTGSIAFGDPDSTVSGLIQYITSTDAMTFSTQATARMSIDSSGDVTFTGDLIMADGKGIDFSADANNAGMSSEILDDYEEGAYTVALTCGTSGTITITGSKNTLMYTKVGRLVYIQGEISVDSVNSPTGSLYISLPFSVGDEGDLSERFVGAFSPQHITFPANTIQAHVNSYASQSTARIQLTIDGGAWSYLGADTVSASTEIVFGFSYVAA